MYGLINNALKSMIQEKYGEETWQQVLTTSGVPEDSFLTMRSYDDAITYQLADAVSTVLNTPMDTCLSLFGEYWVLEAATKSYGSLMDASGHNLIAFLGNLNTLHDRITSTFLNYTPPEFRIENIDDQRYRIHYISTRSGLTPFVVGLLKGLAKRFNTALDILNQHQIPTDSGTHTVFDVILFANEF